MILNDAANPPVADRTNDTSNAQSVRDQLRRRVQTSPLQRRVESLLARTTYRRVANDHELEIVRRHRHDEYVAAGNLDPRADGLLLDGNDGGRASRVYTAWVDGELAGSIRLSVLRGTSREGLTVECFPDIVIPMLDAGLTLIDPNRLTTTGSMARAEPLLVFVVLRLATMAAHFYGAEHCLTPIRAQHGRFYRRFLHATRLGDERRFPGTTAEMELYDVHVPSARQAADRGNPFLLERPGESEAIFPSLAELGLESEVRRAAG